MTSFGRSPRHQKKASSGGRLNASIGGGGDEIVDDGPWRATRLWNSIVRNLQQGLPLKRHRRQLRTYDNCFTALEAIDWLHKHLKKNPNFDAEVSKEQTVLLLGKLLLAGVIQPVSTTSSASSFSSDLNLRDSQKSLYNGPEFKANNDLYRLGEELLCNGGGVAAALSVAAAAAGKKSTPNKKNIRTPLREKNAAAAVVASSGKKKEAAGGFGQAHGLLRSSFRRTLNEFRLQQDSDDANDDDDDEEEDEENVDVADSGGRKYSLKARQTMNLSFLQSLPSNSLVVLDNDSTWRSVYVQLLEKSLSPAHVKSLEIDAAVIIYNMTNVSAKGVVQLRNNPEKEKEDLPSWTLSAMKCLANWSPESKTIAADANIPSYPGFENDVFEVVKDYFVTLAHKKGPLTTYKLFDIFVSAFIKAEAVGLALEAPPNVDQNTESGCCPANEISHIVDRRKSMNRQYTETNLDEDEQAKTSTPNGSSSSATNSRRHQLRSNSNPKISRENHYFTLQRPAIGGHHHNSNADAAASGRHWPSEEVYGSSAAACHQERVAKVRQTYEITVPPPHHHLHQQPQPQPQPIYGQVGRSGTEQRNPLNPNMSTTAIMRNFLPPNTCFETAFMNESPTTRIVPQKGSETLHLMHMDIRDLRASTTLKCYTPISSGGSLVPHHQTSQLLQSSSSGYQGWDSRSIATQTSQDDDEERKEQQQQQQQRGGGRSRWRRSAYKNKRKSIAVMEQPNVDKEVEGFSCRARSTSPSRLRRQSMHEPVRSKSAVPQQRRQSLGPNQAAAAFNSGARDSRGRVPAPPPCHLKSSSSVDNFLNERRSFRGHRACIDMNESSQLFLSRYHQTNNVTSKSGASDVTRTASVNGESDVRSATPSENMIRSKTVRAEKRKQRDKQQLKAQMFATDQQQQQLLHPLQQIQLPIQQHQLYHPQQQQQQQQQHMLLQQQQHQQQQESVCNYYYVQPPAASLPNDLQQYVSPNNSGNSSSTLSGSANAYNQRRQSGRMSTAYGLPPGLQVKPPSASCDHVIDRPLPASGGGVGIGSIMDKLYNGDGRMMQVRAEPYTPSVESSITGDKPNGVSLGNSPLQQQLSEQGSTSASESFRLLSLLLPPENRRKLQLLLKFMRRLSTKEGLDLTSDPSYNRGGGGKTWAAAGGRNNMRSFVLDTFTEVIISTETDTTYDVSLSKRIVSFFMDNYEQVWMPPTSLRKEVGERVYQSLVSKRLEAGEDPFPITFCKRVPSRVYEREKKTALEDAMANLLEQILFDPKMSEKEKKKKLKKFKESHPNVYSQRFPTPDSEPDYMQQLSQAPGAAVASVGSCSSSRRRKSGNGFLGVEAAPPPPPPRKKSSLSKLRSAMRI